MGQAASVGVNKGLSGEFESDTFCTILSKNADVPVRYLKGTCKADAKSNRSTFLFNFTNKR